MSRCCTEFDGSHWSPSGFSDLDSDSPALGLLGVNAHEQLIALVP
jgi:hypothetical protein